MGLARGPVAALAAATVAAAGLVAGCTETLDGPSLVLTLASPDTAREPNGPAINTFVREVQRRSSGTIRVDVAWDVTPEGDYDWDQVVARKVAAGRYDLGLVPSRAFDVLGVDSLRALNTPFLVDSDARMRAVLASDVREDLLAGLPEAGLVGLDLWPSEMRRFFGLNAPVLRPADFIGEKFRSPTSETVEALLRALGATVVHTKRGTDGQRGLESTFATAGPGSIATGNVVPFPKVETLVATGDLRARIQPGEWQVLVDAAAATRREQLASFPSDVEEARQFCRTGSVIVAATPPDVAAFRRIGDVVRRRLERDPATARLIDEVAAVVATVPASDPITQCPAQAPAGPDADDTAALDGIYVTRVTRRDMIAAGVTDAEQIKENTGRITWTLDNGSWHHVLRADHYVPDAEQSGSYTYRDGLFTLYWGAEEVITAKLDIAVDGSIRFHDLRDNLPELQAATEAFFGQPWRRVGDLQD